MDEIEIGMQTASHIPMWLQMAVAMAGGMVTALGGWEAIKYGGMVTALGGWEAIKYLLSLRANRRKDKAEAAQGEALAGQSDADLRQKELALLNDIVETTKQQYGELKQRYDELLVERKADRQEMADLRREVAELRLALADNEKETTELRRAFDDSDCAVADCTQRVPPIGTYGNEASGIKPDGQPVIRDKKGRFTKKADEGEAEG